MREDPSAKAIIFVSFHSQPLPWNCYVPDTVGKVGQRAPMNELPVHLCSSGPTQSECFSIQYLKVSTDPIVGPVSPTSIVVIRASWIPLALLSTLSFALVTDTVFRLGFILTAVCQVNGHSEVQLPVLLDCFSFTPWKFILDQI